MSQRTSESREEYLCRKREEARLYKVSNHELIKQHARQRTADGKQKEYVKLWKKVAVLGYGGKCRCCGESTFEFLTIDHVEISASEERKLGLRNGMSLYLRIA